jgi:hypothetical protein
MPIEVWPHAGNACIGAAHQALTRLMRNAYQHIAAVVSVATCAFGRALENGLAARSGKEQCFAQRFIT